MTVASGGTDRELFRSSVRAFLDREVDAAIVRAIDETDRVPDGLAARLAELGYLGVVFPEEYGGAGGTVSDLLVLMEELTAVSTGLSGVVGTTALFGGLNVLNNGTEEQRRELLPAICRGELRCAMAITEPDAGSDVAAVTTRAVRDGDVWRLDGTKMFITGADEADLILVVTRTGHGERRYDGLTVFLVPRRSPGLQVRRLPKLGTRGLSACEVVFREVQVPLDAVLGGIEQVGRGWMQVMRTFELERIVIAAQSLGTARAAFDEAAAYARDRHQFGRPIGRFQGVSHLLADMATNLEACRALLESVALRYQRGEPCTKEAAMLKLFVTERTKEICLGGMQILGGYGYIMEQPMQRHLRDSLLGPVGAGTSQIQRNIIAKHLGL